MAKTLEVRRLTPAESEREQQYFSDRIPSRARIKWVCKRLDKTDRTVARYRKILLANCREYQALACLNGIDSPVLLRRQIELLEEFCELVAIWKSVDAAIAQYNLEHPHPMDIEVKEV